MSLASVIYGSTPPRAGDVRCSPTQWWRKGLRHPAGWAGLCLALLVPLALRLPAVASKASESAGPEEFCEAPCFIDSFSEPSVACAILKQEADRLLQRCWWDHDRALVALEGPDGGAQPAVAPTARPGTDRPDRPGEGSDSQAAAVQPLRALDRQVQDVQLNLTRNLLVAFLNQGLWSEYVDRYLQLVQATPGRSEVTIHARSALDCARKCGRVEEVLDALQHVIRYHPELRTAQGLKDVLAEWKTGSLSSLEISQH